VIASALPVSVPTLTASQLRGRILASAQESYAGYAESNATFGLPPLAGLTGLTSLLDGVTKMRVWQATPTRWRVDVLSDSGERDTYQLGRRSYIWDSGAELLTEVRGRQTFRLPRPADLVPPALALRLLSEAGRQARFSVIAPLRVAGRSAAGLRMTPADPASTVGRVDIWADPASGLPLMVEIFGRGGSARPALESKFFQVSPWRPDPRVLTPVRAYGTGFTVTSASNLAGALSNLGLVALAEGGRAISVLDRSLVVMSSRQHVHHLLRVEDIPVALAGISSPYLRNAMAAAAAALGAGVPEEAVVQGLRSFVLDPESNPGRANVFELEGRVVVVDYAHNEDGMRGLVEICQGLRPRHARIFLAFGTAGDRTNVILHRLAYAAARGADRLAIAELQRYLRGRDPQDLIERLQAGLEDGGKGQAPVFPNEVEALEWMVKESAPNEVIAVTALAQRPEIFEFLRARGGVGVGPARIRELIERARS